MLGKLLKYEFKATARMFIPFYIAIIVLSLLNRVVFGVLQSSTLMAIPRFLTMAVYVFLIIATFIMTYLVMIQRFYKNLLGEEGYLSMTLPVKVSSHLLAKSISAFAWIMATMFVTFLSILLMIPDLRFILEIPDAFREASRVFKDEIGLSFSLFLLMGIEIMCASIITSVLMIYTAISLGQLSNKHRVLASFGAYIAIYSIIQTINVSLLVIGSQIFESTFNAFYEYTTITSLQSNFIIIIMLGILGLQIVYGVSYFFLTRYLLDKKLNLVA